MTTIPSPSISARIKNAEKDVILEVVREAEVYLNAQLTAGIAADARAYNFAGAVAAATVLLVGASYTLTNADAPNVQLVITCLCVAGALFVSAWMAVLSARSVEFEYAGNEPCKWIADIEEGRPLMHSIAEQCEHYDGMIAVNKRVLDTNGNQFNWAVNIALSSIGFGGVSFMVWMAQVLNAT